MTIDNQFSVAVNDYTDSRVKNNKVDNYLYHPKDKSTLTYRAFDVVNDDDDDNDDPSPYLSAQMANWRL